MLFTGTTAAEDALSTAISVPSFSLRLLLAGILGTSAYAIVQARQNIAPILSWSPVAVCSGLLAYTLYTYGRFPFLLSYGFESVNCARGGAVDFTVLDALLLAPVAEEVTYRALPLGLSLALKSKPTAALLLLVGTIAFALSHQSYTIWEQVQVGVAGMVYGLLFLRTGRLWVPVAAHSVSNLFVRLTELGLHFAGYDWCE